jgi:hypothetical protein
MLTFEEVIDDAIKGSLTKYYDFQYECFVAIVTTLNAKFADANELHDTVSCRKFLLTLYKIIRDTPQFLIERYADDWLQSRQPYNFNNIMTRAWGCRLSASLMGRMFLAAAENRHWRAIRILACYLKKWHPIAICLSRKDLQDVARVVVDVIREQDKHEEDAIEPALKSDFMKNPPVNPLMLYGIIAPSLLSEMMAATPHNVVDIMSYRCAIYRWHAERLSALIRCVEEGYYQPHHLATEYHAALRFLNLARRLPRDLQELLANRVYGCSRDIVPLQEADESIYWALRLGPKYEDPVWYV